MVTPTYPGVYIEELTSPVHPITGAATSIGAFVGYTARGIDNRAETIYSFSDYQRLFGGLASNSELSYAVQQFFGNGGSQAYVVRVPRTGATGAAAIFDGLTFTALSSGSWANGQVLIDVDCNGIAQPLAGSVKVTNGSPTVNGTNFQTLLQVNQILVFASDPTQTQYTISAITGNTALTVSPAYNGAAGTVATTAFVIVDPTAFNLTITNLVDGTTESFPNLSLNPNLNNYVANVVNDPDNGSQLVNVVVGSPTAGVPPPVTGIVGSALTIASVGTLLGGTAVAATMALTNNSAAVTSSAATGLAVGDYLVFTLDPTLTPYPISAVAGVNLTLSSPYAGASATASAAMVSTTSATANNLTNVTVTAGSPQVQGAANQFSALTAGQSVLLSSDPTNTLYQISSVGAGGGTLQLTRNYAGASSTTATLTQVNTVALGNCGVALGTSLPLPSAMPPPLPINVTVFANKTPLPQTVSGLASQLQKALNSALAVQMPGASVVCSASGVGTGQAIRVNALLPQFPDAVITITTPPTTSGLGDASVALGLNAPATTNVAHYALGTGNNWQSEVETPSSVGLDGTGLPGTADLIGNQGSASGIYALQNVDQFNLLCIPDATRAVAGNPAVLDYTVDPNAIYSAAIALCDSKRAMLLLDCPPYVNTIAAAVDWKTSGLTVIDPNGAAFFPRLRLPDPLNNYNLRTFAPCGVVAGLYAQTDASRGVWKAPAGTAATLAGVQSLVYKMSDAENGALNPLGLNCFRTFPVYGSVLWGARTLVGADAEASQWKYVPVRRVALFLESSLYQGTQWVVFEPNDEPLWSSIRLNIGAFMQNLFTQGYFQGQTPSQAYFVKCDSETTTQTDIDNGVVNIVVGFAPLYPAEFVIIQIQQMSGQTAN